MTELVRYDAACRAIADAKAVDEVKDVHDRAAAMQLYARQANNKELEVDAAEIRIRAERRLGEMIALQKQAGGMNIGGRPSKTGAESEPVTKPTLNEIGISKKLSSHAQKVAAVPKEQFEGMICEWRDRITKENERVTANLLKAGSKAMSRSEKEAALAEKILSLPDMQFGVILADPPWRFSVRSELGLDRSAENHYPCQSTDEIERLDVPSISADDCVLFLWATVPMLKDALCVMDAWGFEYKSHIIWVKDRVGTGYWFRNQHELLLVGTKGKIPAPEMGTQWNSVVDAPVADHSAKPAEFIRMIEEYYPNLPKLEMNHRGDGRPGWYVWGLEANERD